ncbi:ZPR1 zinc-finger domain-containing protein [Infundibulicybe gibba]|nr:ZPR1 zinc-finger domain-containing protein [Infundibulicybe gibba]
MPPVQAKSPQTTARCARSNRSARNAGSRPGETRLMLTTIPYFKEVIVIPTCEIVIPQYELTLPSTTHGQLTTVGGLIRDIVADLSTDQPLRKIQDEEGYHKILTLVDKLKLILRDDEDADEVTVGAAATKDLPMPAFTIRLDDPAGNSFVEFIGSMADPKWNLKTYPRTLQQNIAIGLVAAPISLPPGTSEEIYVFPGVCSSCGHPLDTLMKKVVIPYFKDILIMSTNCDRCDYRDNEVKSGSAISEKGKKITPKVEDREDLSRDILKSETSGLTIPEIDLVLQHGTLGGRFTTLEGILEQVFASGDASDSEDRRKFELFLKNLKEVKNAERPFTVIIDDPLANSYVQNLYAPDPDPNMTIETYNRTWAQNEELGLNDMKVEGYESDKTPKDAIAEVEASA